VIAVAEVVAVAVASKDAEVITSHQVAEVDMEATIVS
jgi:hypothetical protein